jgi:hypothetical protein
MNPQTGIDISSCIGWRKVITLKRLPDRMDAFKTRCHAGGIPTDWFGVLYGYDAKQIVADIPDGRDGWFNRRGDFGCYVSHLCAYHELMQATTEWALLVEDDCVFALDFMAELTRLLPLIPLDAHGLYLGGEHITAPIKYDANFYKVMGAQRTHGILYRTSKIPEIYIRAVRDAQSIDQVLRKAHPDLRFYCPHKHLVAQAACESTIGRSWTQDMWWHPAPQPTLDPLSPETRSSRHARLTECSYSRLIEEVTLICADCVDVERAAHAMDLCRKQIPFKHVKLLSDQLIDYDALVQIPKIHNLREYTNFCLRDLHKHFSTPHCLIVQHDGWICEPRMWTDSWLQYDFIGTAVHAAVADGGGNGGFSLRSHALMEAAGSLIPTDYLHQPWEDFLIFKWYWAKFKERGFKKSPHSVCMEWGADCNDYSVRKPHVYIHPEIPTFGVHRRSPISHPRYSGIFCETITEPIVSARYGAQSSWVDVTEAVRQMNTIEVNNDTFGDPKYGAEKLLVMRLASGETRRLWEGSRCMYSPKLHKDNSNTKPS